MLAFFSKRSGKASARSASGPWEALSIGPVPEAVAKALKGAGFDPVYSHFCVPSRLSPAGAYRQAWMAADHARAAVLEVGADGLAELIWQGDIAKIRQASTRSVTGGGALILQLDGDPQEIMRFDVGQASLFGGIAHCLQRQSQRLREGEAAGAMGQECRSLLEKQRALYCPKCRRLLPRNTQVCRFCVEKGSTLGRILRFSLPYWRQLAIMATLMIAGAGLQLIPPQITRVLIDDVLLSPDQRHRLLGLVGLMGLVMVCNCVVGIARARLGIWVGCHVTNDVQARAFNHLQALSLSFFNKQQTGALMSRVNNDARQMQGFLVDGIQYTVVNILTVIGVAAVLLWMNPFLGVLVLLPTPFVVLLSAYVWRRIGRRFRLLWIAMASVTSFLNDALTGIRVIKTFGREESEKERFRNRLAHARSRAIAAEQTWQTLVPILNLIVQSSLLLVWYFGAFEVYGERLTIGGLVAYVGYLGMIYGPLQLLTRLNDWLTRSLTAAARIFEVLDTQAEIEEKPDAAPMPNMRGRIQLRNVTFGYEKHEPVLNDIDLEIPAGEMVGLVGKSGAGKSTLINLIGRLYDVDEGQILIDGVDARDIKVRDLRRNIGFVLQETFLFNGTVADNIAYARPDAPREAILEAAVSANAHGFIMNLPDAYDTIVGERGARLSGGERQRIAIARTLLQDPKILILDEATSSVDTETEARIQHALARLVKGRTTIAIAHRLSTLRHATKLVVIQDGRILEEGTHAELMRNEDGVYRTLVSIQTEWSRVVGAGQEPSGRRQPESARPR